MNATTHRTATPTQTAARWRALLCFLLLPVAATALANEGGSEDEAASALSSPLVELPADQQPPALVEPEPGQVASLTRDGLADLVIAPGSALAMLGETVQPGEMSTLNWSPQNMFEGMPVPTPVLVANGSFEGPVLCMTGAVHGDEINGIETIRRVMHALVPEQLSGTVIGVPIVNQMGFRRSSRYLPDRRDLNRYFPGSVDGSSAARIAHSLFNEVIRQCDALVDMHTGSFHRTNIPQLRADLQNASVRDLVKQFGDIVVLHSEGSIGMLRREATFAGIPTVTLEAGEAMRIQEDVVKTGVRHLNTLLTNMGMVKHGISWNNPQPMYMASRWLRAQTGGIFISKKSPGDRVVTGERLGTITDPITNDERIVYASFPGKIIGMAMNQVVLPGYAIYHVGMEASLVEEKLQTPRAVPSDQQTVDDPLLDDLAGQEHQPHNHDINDGDIQQQRPVAAQLNTSEVANEAE